VGVGVGVGVGVDVEPDDVVVSDAVRNGWQVGLDAVTNAWVAVSELAATVYCASSFCWADVTAFAAV
jgi:hypothetical protein